MEQAMNILKILWKAKNTGEHLRDGIAFEQAKITSLTTYIEAGNTRQNIPPFSVT